MLSHCLRRPTASIHAAAYDSGMSSRAHSRSTHRRQAEAASELARAEADYRRLRQAYEELAEGELNEVALAMVGADMARASASLLSLA
jgi:hypothetical protein